MFLTARPFEQGRFSVITGPVDSDKTKKVKSFLDAVVDSGYKREDNIVVFRHPDDDIEPERIGRHEVKVTGKVDEIYEGILPQTRTVVIIGASHYKDEKIEKLADAIVRSNRDLVVSGLNLDAKGKSYGFMPGLITLADEIFLAKSICSYSDKGCRNTEANRSMEKEGNYSAVCSLHYSYPDCPVSLDWQGSLRLYLGPMFSGKTTEWGSDLRKMQEVGWEPLVLKYLHDDRSGEKEGGLFGWGKVTLHSGEKVPAVSVKTGKDIKKYLEEHPEQKDVFINEGQFFRGLYDLVFEFIPEGRRFYIDALLRDFARRKFNEVADLVCLADRVNTYYATCVKCGHPAAENQRMKRVKGEVVPAHIKDQTERIGGKDKEGAECFYEARCLDDWVLDGEPELYYKLERFCWG